MADGTLRERYRIEIRRAGTGFTGTVEFMNGYDAGDAAGGPNVDRYKSLRSARDEASKWVNTFQSSGIDVEARVFGKVFGQSATIPTRPLAPEDVTAMITNEVVYAMIDAPARGRRQRIRLANKDATPDATVITVDPDVDPDLVP